MEQEDQKGDAAEDGGQDHGGLDRLHRGEVLNRVIEFRTVRIVDTHFPDVCKKLLSYPPGIVDGGDEEQGRGRDVEDDDEGQKHQHFQRAPGGAEQRLKPRGDVLVAQW